jgi:small conductance mechanosensitive channel
MIGSCHSCDEYYAIVASPTEQIPSAGFRSGLLTALPGILTEAAYVLILIIYVRNCSMMTEDEIRALEKGRKKEENMLREQMHDFAYRFLFVLCAVVSLLYFFRYSLFPKGSIEYYIFANEWARGFHIFSFTRCLIYIAVAVFVLATVSRLGTAVASLLMSRQETFVRMGLSFLKYGVGIATVFVCASLLGAPTASLLASAGVLSVVLSFGAQNIVADIIAGLFIVFEGTFKVGDMITVDDWHGQVQEIGIRNTTIRDLILEDVKIMNNSTIRSIINYSERPCWSPITVGVDYDTDIPALEAAFEREKAGMKKNIPLGIGEIVYLGIDELSGSQMTLKFQILCRNQDQLKVKRALNREVRLMLARNGFIIPFPQVTISTRKNREEDEEEEMEREKEEEMEREENKEQTE